MKENDKTFVRAYYPWNEDLAKEAKADTPHNESAKEKPIDTAEFEYSIEIACSVGELNSYQVGAFSLGKTKEEASISLWTKSQTDKGFSLLTASVNVNEPKSLIREFFISSGHSSTFDDVSPVKKGTGTHAEFFVPIKPSIQVYDRLAWPKVGFFYHFIDDELVNEYQLSGGEKSSFKVTYSKGKTLSSDLLSDHEYAFILLPWKIENTVISRQHLLYTKEKMTEEKLSEINAQWLDENACLVNPDEAVNARSDDIIEREKEDNGKVTYAIQSGETLDLIAKKQGITYDAILTLNPQIKNPDIIEPGKVITIKDAPTEQENTQLHVCKINPESGAPETWSEIAGQYGVAAKELFDLNADNPIYKGGALALDNELRVKKTTQSEEGAGEVCRNALSPEDVSGNKWVFSFLNVWSVIEKQFSDVAHVFVQDDTALNKHTPVIKVNSVLLHSTILSCSDGLEALAQEKKEAIKKGDKDEKKKNDIKAIQKALLALNFDLGKHGADGDFGAKTEQAVVDFQSKFVPTHEVHTEYEIKEKEGVIDNQTLLALDEAVTLSDESVRAPQTIEDYRSRVREINFNEDFNEKLMQFSGIFDEFYSYTKENKILKFVNKEELVDAFFEDDRLGRFPSHKTRIDAKEYIESTNSLGFTSQNIPGQPIFALNIAGGEHLARHEVMHLLSAEGGMTQIVKTSGNLNEALTEVTTRIIEDVLVQNDQDTIEARKHAYPALAELLLGITNSSEAIMAGLFEGYIKDGGLDKLIDPMVERWKERSESGQITKTVNWLPKYNQDTKMRGLLVNLTGYLGGALSLEQASEDFGTKNSIGKMKVYIGF
ncbi:LysM peptidoglycan-binding domain-containing protein [Aliivibrio logei]|uniref:LysM domain-containing protein n=1 Tax=Aliivibrio logei TaxID=688 RepID=A0A1B9NWC7_ALILO|nr:LysM peptidoglycan-binding domain-containing protein [Aliivibrio logei]OCH19517.1 hypothetical protein A6E04_15930 [Aliivibrio logei]